MQYPAILPSHPSNNICIFFTSVLFLWSKGSILRLCPWSQLVIDHTSQATYHALYPPWLVTLCILALRLGSKVFPCRQFTLTHIMVAIASFYSFTKFISYPSGSGGGGGGGHRNKNGGGFTTLWNMQHQLTHL